MTVRPSAPPAPASAPGWGEGSGPRPAASGAPHPCRHFPLLSFLYLFSLHGELAMVPGRDSLQGAGLGLPGVPGPQRAPPPLTAPAFPTVCGYFCHPTCAPQAPPCPVPPALLHTALGVHPETGTGTAYEGFLSVSRRWGRGERAGGQAAGARWDLCACLPSPRCHGPRVSGGAGSECSPPSATHACCSLMPQTRSSARPAGPSCRLWI